MAFVGSVLLLAMLTWFFSDTLKRQLNPNRNVVTELANGERVVRLKRNKNAQYLANGKINGTQVQFLVDTGASDVVISETLALKLGIKKQAETIGHTANGVTRAWVANIKRVTLGEIEVTDVETIILPNSGEEVLLGMTFLANLELIQRDGVLTIRQR